MNRRSDTPGRRGGRVSRKLFFLLMILLPGLVCVALAGEILVRCIHPTACLNLRLDEIPFEHSAMLRHVWQRGGRSVRIRNQSMPINSLGYRGPEFSPEKAPGTFRIIIYGGSQVFDMNVGGFDDWPHRLQRLLDAGGRGKLEVINGGVLGNVSWEATAWLLGEGHRFAPDVVILCNEWNELTYLSSSDFLVRHFGPFDRRDNPQMYSVNALDRFLARFSCLYRGLRWKYLQWEMNIGAEGSRRKASGRPELEESAFEQYRLNLCQFIDLCRRIGAEPMLMLQPRLPVPDAGPEARAKIRYEVHHLDHEQLCEAFRRMDVILESVAAGDQVRLLRAGSQLSGRPEYFEDHIHFNDAGSRMFAELLAKELAPFPAAQEGLLD